VPLVVAEGSWALAHGFRFSMSYCANFQQATAVYDSTARVPLTLVEPGQPPRSVELPSGMGYEHEIAYFLHCIQQGRQPTVVTLQEALQSVRIVEAEVESLTSGRRVELDGQPSS
jgi:predicted dehydrogenase